VDKGCGFGDLCDLPPSKPDEIIKDPNDNENDEIKRQDELFTLQCTNYSEYLFAISC
jgi:hypothetical protein